MELRPYQREVHQFAELANGRFMYADDAGSGKTFTTATMIAGSGATLNLVLVPNDTILEQWVATFKIADPEMVVHGVGSKTSPKRRHHTYGEVITAAKMGQRSVLVTTYDLLRTDDELLATAGWQTVVADEAHRLKNRNSLVNRAARKATRRAILVVLVSGTFILNAAEELWAQLNFIDPKTYSSFWRWATEHFEIEQTTFRGKLVEPVTLIHGLKDGHDELLRRQLADDRLMIARDIDRLLPGLPPVHTHIVPVELSEAEREAYDHMVRKSWTHVGGRLVQATNTVAKLTRLRQMASEWSALAEDGGGTGAKVEAAAQTLQGASEQAVVLAAFRGTVERLVAALPGSVAYTGSTPREARRRAVEGFKAGEHAAIVGTIAALGEGVDGLQVARAMLRLDRDWTPARNTQVVARVRRSGQTADAVHVIDYVASDTVDEYVADTLAGKSAVIERLRPAA